MTKVTHLDLLVLGKTLGYNDMDKGLCRGFSCMWAQAVLAADEASFFTRLELIGSYKRNFERLKRDIDQAKAQAKTHIVLDERAKSLLQVLAFFDGIALYLRPDEYSDIFPGAFITQADLTTIYPLAKSEQLKHSELEVLLNKPYAFNQDELTRYLIEIEGLLNQAPLKYPILLSNGNHSVCLTYDKETKTWEYIDTNDFARYSQYPSYVRKLSCAETVISIFHSLDGHTHVAFETTLLTSSDTKSARLKDEVAKLDKQYAIFPELTARYNQFGVGLLYLACRGGHQTMVQTLVQCPKIEVNKVRNDGVTPLYIACENGHQGIVDILLKHDKIKVNKANNDDITPLHIACFNGHQGIVDILLKHDKIKVNKADNVGITPLYIACQLGREAIVDLLVNHDEIGVDILGLQGHTPLQVACLSPYTHDKPTIFQSLLSKNASLTHQNELGECALDIAFVQNNHLAITTLLTFAYTQTINPDNLMSEASLEKAIKWSRQCLPEVHNYLVQSQLKPLNTVENSNHEKRRLSQKNFFSAKKIKLNEPLQNLDTPNIRNYNC
ncbi:ankyrin repeat domain-containing protein [Legionella gresilensis]|uniref:ankyrin repeat domain-containing protein n=1 Tax=Legionella gresilensis TaxID=91823 RepID=UPI001040F1FE|nr:ankyrin repeat domain-containing protein [Legionella gresilensis]